MESDQPISSFVCKQATCKFPTDGECIEGLPPPGKCPYRSARTESAENVLEDKVTSPPEVVYIGTHKGEALTDQNCDALMAGVSVKFIMLAGLKESGKSTLLGSLIQLFQDNSSFANYSFAGSNSLIGFERICHQSRLNSGRDKPGTVRTAKGLDGILHLKIKSLDPESEKVDLLLTDLSGEDFNDLSKSTEFSKRFTMARRVDHFVLLLDSDLLSKVDTRQVTKTNSISVLLGLLDAEMILPDTKIDIVFSRWDLLIAKDDREKHEAFISLLKEDLKKRINPYNLTITFFEIASRPNRLDVLEFGYGLAELFTNWLTSRKIRSVNPENYRPSINANREFSKYIAK